MSEAETPTPLADLTVRGAMDAIAARTPTPGGGAVGAIVGGLAAALGRMVLNFSIGKKSLAEHDDDNAVALTQLQTMTDLMLELAEADARAFAVLNDLWKLDKDDPKRVEQWDDAVEGAIDPPRRMLAASVGMLEALAPLVGRTNDMLRSDLAIAAILAAASARASAWNVAINLPLISDEERAQELTTFIETSMDRADELNTEIESGCA